MKTWEIWSEGYVATGQNAGAQLHGTAKAVTFGEAAEKLLAHDPFFDARQMRYWGCRLFDNEAAARWSFG